VSKTAKLTHCCVQLEMMIFDEQWIELSLAIYMISVPIYSSLMGISAKYSVGQIFSLGQTLLQTDIAGCS
jgi:hypothetical protein